MDKIEKNKLIAKFMGYEVERNYAKHPLHGSWIEIENMYYDSSWDSLMPIVEKIQSLEKTPPPNYTGYRFEIVIGGYVLIEGIPTHRIMKNVAIEDGTLNAIYEAVVEFIQNYKKYEK